MKYTEVAIAIIFSGVLFFSGCGSSSSSSSKSPENTPTPTSTPNTPNVLGSTTIVTTAGQTIQVDRTEGGFIFHGYEGKIVLLEVYGDTCPHCIAAIPSYNRLQAKYPNDVVVIALESYGTLTNAGQQQYITVPRANTGSMFSFIQSLTGYHLEAVPYLMILDRSGDKVYSEVLSDFPESTIESYIQQLQ